MRWSIPITLFYLILIFPFAWFRHDDWGMLTNSLRGFEDPSFFFKGTIYFRDIEEVWFFRPIFKFLPGFWYKLFGFNYYLWNTAVLGIFLWCIHLTQKTYTLITEKKESQTFALFTSLYFIGHFGSLFWIGEGLMNIPLLLFLCFNTYYFAKYHKEGNKLHLFLSMFFLCLAFMTKEAAFFHLPLLGIILIEYRGFDRDFGKSFKQWLPFFILSIIYLVIRFSIVGVRPGYGFEPNIKVWVKSLAMSLGPIFLPWFLAFVFSNKFRANLLRSPVAWLFLVYIGLSMAPFWGKTFFSPGWLTVPVFFSLFFMTFYTDDEPILNKKLMISMTLISTLAIGAQLYRLNWYQWKAGQIQFFEIAKKYESNTLIIRDCAPPHVNVQRVVGYPGSLRKIFKLLEKDVQVSAIGCQEKALANYVWKDFKFEAEQL